MITLLKQAVTLKALRLIDYYFSKIVEPTGPITLAAALLSQQSGVGHVCVPLDYLNHPDLWFDGLYPKLSHALWSKASIKDTASWQERLLTCNAVGNGHVVRPIVLEHSFLYLHRLWHDETTVANFFSQTCTAQMLDVNALMDTLAYIFYDEASNTKVINWQKVAVAIALTNKSALILGGPGTGKTTTIARLLAALLHLSFLQTKRCQHQSLRIKLAAPTGKAATRLISSIKSACTTLKISDTLKAQIPTVATTLHQLLKLCSDTLKGPYSKSNPLPLDVLIVDEASMVDLPMMARIIRALPAQARLFLFGDPHQLASIEAGAVLGDLAATKQPHYSQTRALELSKLTGYHIPYCASTSSQLQDSSCHLHTHYRFQKNSILSNLAQLIQKGDGSALIAYLKNEQPSLRWIEHNEDNYKCILQECVKNYGHYLQLIHSKAAPIAVLNAFKKFQLLCALRHGPFGVAGLNLYIENALHQNGLIKLPTHNQWYSGRPIMVTVNHEELGLSNGDIGVTLPDHDGRLQVYFEQIAQIPKSISPYRLPICQTSYALTIHKAQGSEFAQTLLVLPPSWSPLLTRELLYSATTRAKEKLTIYTTMEVLQITIQKINKRCSGLRHKLHVNSQ